MSAPRALVMAGGRGTRLRGDGPKPLARIAGVPLLELAVRRLHRAGLLEITLALGHGAPEIRAHLAAWRDAPLQPELLVEEQPLGTLGALSLLPEDGRPVLVTNADLVTTSDPRPLLEVFAARRADLLLATRAERHRLRFGEVLADADGRVTDYLEKPEKRWRIAAGSCVVGPAARALLPRGERCDVPELVRRALAAGLLVIACPDESAWVDVNDAEDLRAAEELLRREPAACGAPGEARTA
jgi:NDP-sugar pyrophosphorylase family protein